MRSSTAATTTNIDITATTTPMASGIDALAVVSMSMTLGVEETVNTGGDEDEGTCLILMLLSADMYLLLGLGVAIGSTVGV